MPTIASVSAREIATSKGQKTIEVSVATKSGIKGVAAVPAGTSTGTFEVAVLPTDQAIRNIDEIIAPRLLGLPVDDQRSIDKLLIDLDGTESKQHLGGNTIVGLSMAVARAGALATSQPLYKYLAALSGSTPQLPTPLCVVIEGGRHGSSPRLSFQEFLIGAPITQAARIYNTLSGKLPAKTGLEGAFAPDVANRDALNVLTSVLEESGGEAVLGLDVAASSLSRPPEVSELVELASDYPISYLEDPLPEEAWHLWAQLKLELNETNREIMLVGDDLFVTNKSRLQKGISGLIANAILIKPNQVGTITETLEVIALAKKAGFTHIVSHRSGETMDDFITDLAVGTAAKFLKAGSPVPRFKERFAKYERLAAIEKELGDS